jgi:hypothetical protein
LADSESKEVRLRVEVKSFRYCLCMHFCRTASSASKNHIPLSKFQFSDSPIIPILHLADFNCFQIYVIHNLSCPLACASIHALRFLSFPPVMQVQSVDARCSWCYMSVSYFNFATCPTSECVCDICCVCVVRVSLCVTACNVYPYVVPSNILTLSPLWKIGLICICQSW